MAKSKNKSITKKRKIKYKNIFLFIFWMLLIVFSFFGILTMKIKNIYVKGNTFLTDQYIIDVAELRDYPTILSINSNKIIKKLEDDVYIKQVKITRDNLFRSITIEVEENKPVVYYEYDNCYLLTDGTSIQEKYNLPILINQTPEDILNELLEKLGELDNDALNRISEIRYYPTDVDEELFYLTMTDGNYVYINFNSFSKLDNYLEILRSFNNKKGIVHLDSGNYLEIIK